MVIALVHDDARIAGARSQDGFTEVIIAKKYPLLQEVRTQVRVYRETITVEDIAMMIDDMRLLRTHIGIAITPDVTGDEKLPDHIVGLSYQQVVELALEHGLIESQEMLAIDADHLSKKQADLMERCHPLSLAKHMVPISRGEVPEIMGTQKGSPWDALEDLVVLVLSTGLQLTTRREGHAKRFQHLPEGYFLVGTRNDIAAMFDCKGSESGYYVMSKNDELRFEDYIRTRKDEIQTLEHADLRHFVIFANEFGGDLELRERAILKETGVHLCVVPLSPFVEFCEEMKKRALAYPEILKLIDWPGLLVNSYLGQTEFAREVERLDAFARSRY